MNTNHVTQCPLCNLCFTDTRVFVQHLKNEHASSCTKCNLVFKTTQELEKHIELEHSNLMSFICEVCENKFSSQQQLEIHQVDKHTNQNQENDKETHIVETNLINCTYCEETFMNEGELENHKMACHNHKCSICQHRTTSKEDLTDHMNAQHSIECPICTKKFQDKPAFIEHFKADHDFDCTKCGQILVGQSELAKHMEKEHTHRCSLCDNTFESNSLLEIHLDECHNQSCHICNLSTKSSKDLKQHIQTEHTFECTMCGFEGTSETGMENHILEKHCTPDEDNQFSCDECEYKYESRQQLLCHYRNTHKRPSSNRLQEPELSPSSQEETNLKEELRVLKSHFQRLEQLFKSSKEEVEKVKSDYEARLMEANDKFRNVKAENEELKEKVDVLFKLGRSYINRKETLENSENTEKEVIKETTAKGNDEIEVIEEYNVDDLSTWTQNKLRGFKRTNPGATPVKNVNSKPNRINGYTKGGVNPNRKSFPTTSPVSPTSSPSSPTPPPTPKPTSSADTRTTGPPRFCHYYVNYGQCSYEERTGEKCKFEHRKAPMCNSGISCTKTKCMFMHPKTSENHNRNNFLGQIIHPWNIINPWMNQMQNSWNIPPMQWSTGRNQYQC